MPTIAECGGFMYLHEELEDKYGQVHKMAGVIPGKSFRTERLKYFGYIKMSAREDSLLAKKGEVIKAHEFHYWDSENKGTAFHIEKAAGDKEWDGIHVTSSFYGGYPHLYFYSNPLIAERFIDKCSEYSMSKVR
jgi:cobyrinic acid a,c-diamide synthase